MSQGNQQPKEYLFVDHDYLPTHVTGDSFSEAEKEHYYQLTHLVRRTVLGEQKKDDDKGFRHSSTGDGGGSGGGGHPNGKLQTSRPEKHELHHFASRSVHHGYFFTPECLRRYLVAQKWDVRKSYEAMLRTIHWREQNALQPFEEEVLVRCHQSRYSQWCGHDREGRPCMFIKSTNADLSIPREERLKYVTIMLEKGLSLMERQHSGKEGVEQWNMIVDETDKGYSHMDNTFVSHVGPILFDHYVERLNKCYLINPGILTTVVVGVVKLFVDDRTSSKIRMVHSKKLPPALFSGEKNTIDDSCSATPIAALTRIDGSPSSSSSQQEQLLPLISASSVDASLTSGSSASSPSSSNKVFAGLTETDGVTPYLPKSLEKIRLFVPEILKELGPQAVPVDYGGKYEIPTVLEYLKWIKGIKPFAVDTPI